MAFSSLLQFIDELDRQDELIRIDSFFDPRLEIPEIADRFSKLKGGGKALLFNNTKTDFPVLINSLGSEKRMSIALGVNDLSETGKEIGTFLETFTRSRLSFRDKINMIPALSKFAGFLPKHISRKAPCQEIIHTHPDLDILPVLKTWPFDGGRFFTFPMVHTIDPDTGIRNVGMYRMQVFNKNSTGMHWHRHKTGASHFEKYKRRGQIMPVVVALGGDPVLTYAATAPLPDQMDEYIFAGFLRKKTVLLTKAITQDIDVPAEADIIIEGYIDPSEDFRREGPFGDHTGFYSLEDDYPVFHVTCITHRKNAVYPATVVGIPPMEDTWIARATERIFLFPVKKLLVPELCEMHLPDFGVAHNLAVVSIRKSYPGQAEKVAHALWGAGQMMFNKYMIVLDEHEDPDDYLNLIRKLSVLEFTSRLNFSKGPLDVLDHASPVMSFGSKLCIDLTEPLKEEQYTGGYGDPFKISREKQTQGKIINTYYTNDFFPGTRILLANFKKDEAGDPPGVFVGNILKSHDPYPRIIILLDDNIDLQDHYLVTWLILNNTDPLRDMWFEPMQNDGILLIDACPKSRNDSNFNRPWPNVIVMDEQTIKDVDEKWVNSIPFPFTESPSLRFKKLVKNPGAVAKV